MTTDALPNGRYGWVEFGSSVAVRPIRWRLRASLSRRQLDVLRDGRLVRRIPIGVGRPGSPTPIGRFAVAEKFTGDFGPAFGCCILALTARQPHLPPGWNTHLTYYVAIHTGSGQGSAVLGRLPARDRGGRPLPDADRSPRNSGADLAMIDR